MRWTVLLTWSAAVSAADAAWSSVTVSGGGQTLAFDRLPGALNWVEQRRDNGVHYLIQAPTGGYRGFVQSSNSTLAWGSSPGVLSVAGDLQSHGTMLFEIDGKSNAGAASGGPVEFDTLLASGDILLAPGVTLAFDVAPGLAFQRGDSLTLMATGDGRSIFADLSMLRSNMTGLPNLPGGLSWDLRVEPGDFRRYQGDSLVLMVVPMPGPAALFALAIATGARRRRR